MSFSTTSALVLSSLSGVVTPMVHADQNGAGEGITITTSEKMRKKKKQINQINQVRRVKQVKHTLQKKKKIKK